MFKHKIKIQHKHKPSLDTKFDNKSILIMNTQDLLCINLEDDNLHEVEKQLDLEAFLECP